MKSEEDLDNLFKKSMDDPANHRAFNEDDWDAFEQMLDAGKKRRGVVYWLPWASAVAAMLILALGWWFFIKPVKIDNNLAGVKPTKNNNRNTKPLATDTDVNKSSQNNNLATAHTKDTIWNKQPDANKLAATKSQKDSLLHTGPAANDLATSQGKPRSLTERKLVAPSVNGTVTGVKPDSDLATSYQQIAGSNKSAGSAGRTQLLANSMTLSSAVTAPSLSAPDFKTEIDMPVTVAASTDKPVKKIIKQGFGYRPQLAITALASSDVNGTSAFQGKAGSNYGALLSLGLTKKLTITSGVVYSSKPYNTSFANYNTAYVFKHPPSDVTADCKMLDIPINIGYQVFGNFRNKISVGTGFSSYIMLHEKYTYNYADGNNPAWPQSYTVPNSKGYYLSILNLNATYERKINSKFGVSVQPYMKVPLSGVGYSDLKLQSTGVAVGVTYNLNAFRKP